jgi:tRNA G18 (ribose-2'-O)-methylase SpoU
MYRFRHIQAFDSPELQPYQTMRRQADHRQEGIFVAEGEKVVRRLLESAFEVVSVLLPQKWFDTLEPVLRQRPEMIHAFIAEKNLLETLTGFSMYQGLLAVGKVPAQRGLPDLLDSCPRPLLLTAVDGLSSAQNIGALVRNCVGLNSHALLVSETCTSPFVRRAVRGSMGAIFQLPVIEGVPLPETLQSLRERGINVVAAHPHVAGRTLTMAELRGDCCIVLGSEGYGISPEVLGVCSDAVAIPMPATVDSLNVVSACALFLYEANRQRGKM